MLDKIKNICYNALAIKKLEVFKMKIYSEVNNYNDFEFWSGARETINYLSTDEIETVFCMLEEIYPEGMKDTELNDFFWFEDDIIAEWLGWPDFDTIMSARSNGKWYDDYNEYETNEENEEDEDEEN